MAFWGKESEDEELKRLNLERRRWEKMQWRWRVAKQPLDAITSPFRRRESQPSQPIQSVYQQPQQTSITVRNGKKPSLLKAIFVVLIVGIFFYFSCSTFLQSVPYLGGTCNIFVSKAEASLGRSFEATKDAIVNNFVKFLKYPEEIGEFKNPDVVSEKPTEKMGVIIQQFESLRRFYNEDEEIRLDGLINIKNVQNDIRLDISCSSKDYNGPIQIELVGEGTKGINEVSTIVMGGASGITRQVQVRCVLPKNSFSIVKDQVRTGKLITLNVKYDVISRTIQDLYVTSQDSLARSGVGRLLFERNDLYQGLVNSGLWKGDGEIRSQQIGARTPIPLSIQLFGRQPFTIQNERIKIGLINTVSDKFVWGGNLEKLNYLRISSLNEPGVSINQDSCESFTDGDLSSIIIKDINDRIRLYCYSDNKDAQLCPSFRDNLIFDCGIMIQGAPQEQDLLEVYKIQADAGYTYRVTQDASIEIRKVENLLFGQLDNSVSGAVVFFTENLLNNP
ncbi:hypothetical protein HYX15_01000 [Candidatus Woesearchaeota archaeon]|nr:hypothetical protein [Candidatus Woesearchaeota archaeon]